MRRRPLCIALSLFFTITLNTFAQVKLSITQTPVSISNNLRTLLKADFNHDGRPDLVTWSNEPRFSVFLNDKTGHFTEITTTTPKPVERLAVADFNKDGFNDVAVCSPTTTSADPSRTISIYRGSGNGNFTLAGTPIIIPKTCAGLTAGDINGDGNPDLVVIERTCANTGCFNYQKTIAVYKGDGSGSFAAPIITSPVGSILDFSEGIGGDPQGADLADFNHDGFLDVIFAQCCHVDIQGNASGGGVLIAFGDGSGHFPTSQLVDAFPEFDPFGEFTARVADTNTDGLPDFVSNTMGDTGPFLFAVARQSNSAPGSYTPFDLDEIPQDAEDHGGHLSTPVAPDLNNDGIKDAAVSFEKTDVTPLLQRIDTLLGRSGGGYDPIQSVTLSEPIDDIVTGDFDGDGRADVVGIGSTALTVALNRTPVARCSAPSGGIRLIDMCLTLSSNNVKVQANKNDNWNVVATRIYIDGNPKAAFFTTDDLITRNFELSPGVHSITVKMWDQHGPFGSSRSVTVPNSACSPSAVNRTVKICAPVDGASLRENLRVQAAITDSKPISEVKIYLDGVAVFSNSTAKTLDVISTKVLSPGLHRITVKAWDSGGRFFQTIFVRK